MAKAVVRCKWAEGVNLDYIEYHDKEWGVPVFDDRVQFEFLILEGAQAGLSWSTILNKRDGYRKAFLDFDVEKVARITKKRIEKLLTDPSIVRNRLKVESTVSNAKAFLEVQKEFGSFSKYIWGFVGGKSIQSKLKKDSDVPATSPESDALSKDLKKRGFHDHVCTHAGDRHGQRPCHALFSLQTLCDTRQEEAQITKALPGGKADV